YLLRLFVDHASRAIESTRLHAELVKRERLSVLGSALSEIVHDLRQPLTVIRAAVALAAAAARKPDKLAEMHRLISLGADDLTSYIDDLLAFTRNEPAILELTTLSELFAGIETKARSALEERQGWLAFHIEGGAVASVAPRKIQRVILNLINNAVQ